MTNKQTKLKGFTIIEVVLVLAVAGLIFLMVFLALPALQRGQRDRQRQSDYSTLSTGITSYSTSSNGTLPGSTEIKSANASKYLNEKGQDPNGFIYNLKFKECTSSGTDCGVTDVKGGAAVKERATIVYVVTHATCNGNKPKYTASARSFAIYGELEAGAGLYCQASQG